jgi:hypothetical protein
MDDVSRIPHFKQDAQITVTLGVQFISRLQAALFYLAGTMSEKERATLKSLVEQQQPLSDRDSAVVTLSTLILNIGKEAERTDQVVFHDIQTALGL